VREYRPCRALVRRLPDQRTGPAEDRARQCAQAVQAREVTLLADRIEPDECYANRGSGCHHILWAIKIFAEGSCMGLRARAAIAALMTASIVTAALAQSAGRLVMTVFGVRNGNRGVGWAGVGFLQLARRFSETLPGMARCDRADSRGPSDLRVHRRSGRKLRDRVLSCRAKRDPADAGSVRQADP